MSNDDQSGVLPGITPGDTRPAWMLEQDANSPADDAIIAAVSAAMAARGQLTPQIPPANLPPTAEQLAALAQQGALPGQQPVVPAAGTLVLPTSGPQSPQATSPVPPPPPTTGVPLVVGQDAGQVPSGASAPAGSSPPPPPPQLVAEGVTPGTALPPPPPPSPSEPAPPPEGYTRVTLANGDIVDLNADQIEYMLQVNTWLDTIPADIKQQWGEIQEGRARAVPAEAYAAYDAWRAAGSPTPQPPAKPDLSDLDPEQRAYLEELERRATPTLPPPAPAPDAPSIDALAAAQRARIERGIELRSTVDAVNAEFAERYGMTGEQLQHLTRVAADLNIVPAIMEKHRRYSPTGVLLQDADFRTVATEAYAMAMAADPELANIHDTYVYNQRAAAVQQANATTDAKKARAGSLATAPSTTVPSGEQQLMNPDGSMNLQATSSAMAATIAEMIANGTASQ